MCYCCNRGEAVRHFAGEVAELLPGEFVGASWFIGLVYCAEYIFFGKDSAHSHIAAYIAVLVAFLVGATVVLLCIRLHDVRFAEDYALGNGGKCYNCGKEIENGR